MVFISNEHIRFQIVICLETRKLLKKTWRNRKALRVGKIKLKNKIMPTIVVRHKVRDIKAWLNGHNDRVKIFAPAISGFKTFQDTDDPKSVVMVIEVTDMEKLAEIMKDTKVMEEIAKAKHTVLEPIIMSMPVAL
jgi:hypothetical protein